MRKNIRGKKGQGRAADIRREAKLVLIEYGEVGIYQLLSILKERMRGVRLDYMLSSLVMQSSGIEVIGERDHAIVRLIVSGQRLRMAPKDFILLAVQRNRPPTAKGLYAYRSGLSKAFHEYFPGLTFNKTIKQLEAMGAVHTLRIGGDKIIFPGRGPLKTKTSVAKTLEKMGLSIKEK